MYIRPMHSYLPHTFIYTTPHIFYFILLKQSPIISLKFCLIIIIYYESISDLCVDPPVVLFPTTAWSRGPCRSQFMHPISERKTVRGWKRVIYGSSQAIDSWFRTLHRDSWVCNYGVDVRTFTKKFCAVRLLPTNSLQLEHADCQKTASIACLVRRWISAATVGSLGCSSVTIAVSGLVSDSATLDSARENSLFKARPSQGEWLLVGPY